MRHGVLPRTLHIDEPSSNVDWASGAVRCSVASGLGYARRAAPSGRVVVRISGTNSHVILEEAPAGDRSDAESSPSSSSSPGDATLDPACTAWVVSARSRGALQAQAERLHTHIDGHPEWDAPDIGFSLVSTRAALPHRALLLGAERQGLMDGLRALAQGKPNATVLEGTAVERPERLAVLFTGQGAQRVGIGGNSTIDSRLQRRARRGVGLPRWPARLLLARCYVRRAAALKRLEGSRG